MEVRNPILGQKEATVMALKYTYTNAYLSRLRFNLDLILVPWAKNREESELKITTRTRNGKQYLTVSSSRSWVMANVEHPEFTRERCEQIIKKYCPFARVTSGDHTSSFTYRLNDVPRGYENGYTSWLEDSTR